MRLAIIGSGPAGVSFYKRIIEDGYFDPSFIFVFDGDGEVCHKLNLHSTYVENIHSICPKRLKFLVDGTKQGPWLCEYFRKDVYNLNPSFTVQKKTITSIERTPDFDFVLYQGDTVVGIFDQVVLATGVRQKLLSSDTFDSRRNMYDWTFRAFEEFKNNDFERSEIIFIGSGDNTLFKASRLAAWVDASGVPWARGCIKIFIKERFKKEHNHNFFLSVMTYVTKGIIEIENSLWNIEKITSGDTGFVRTIISSGGVYHSTFTDGARISVYTGNIPSMPIFKDCCPKDIILTGDIARLLKGKVCSIYDAIQDAEEKADRLSHLCHIKDLLENTYPIGSVRSVNIFESSSSKFVNTGHHFVVHSDIGIFFLKKYPISHTKKIMAEIVAVSKFSDKVRIPKICCTINEEMFLQEGDQVFVMYTYIDAPDLKETSVSKKIFFNMLCDVESQLIKYRKNKAVELYNFDTHYAQFESGINSLAHAMESDEHPHAKRDRDYMSFLVKEMSSMKDNVLALKIPSNFIHGDLLPQNLIRDLSGNLWVIDWEKSQEYMTSVDVLRSVMFLLFDPKKKDLGLSAEEFGSWSAYCLNRISITEIEKSHAADIYYFHLISNIDFLRRLYVEKQDLNEKMAGEDYELCKWFKKNKSTVQTIIDEGGTESFTSIT